MTLLEPNSGLVYVTEIFWITNRPDENWMYVARILSAPFCWRLPFA